jgi:PPOX class probable F420-dependent enzyme
MQRLTEEQLGFALAQRAGRLATVDASGQPHAIPVCYACDGATFYFALDAKPKRVEPVKLKRIRNMLENPRVALVIDRYSDDWSELAYLLVQGTAMLLQPDCEEHRAAVALLRERYPQYRSMPIHEQPVIAISPTKVVSWGALG